MERHRDAGYATVEAALAIPSLLLLTLALAGILAGLATQIQCVDAARLGARAVARGEPPAEVRTAVIRAAPGSSVQIGTQDGLIHVTVAAPVAAVPLLQAFTVRGEAFEADEATDRDTPADENEDAHASPGP